MEKRIYTDYLLITMLALVACVGLVSEGIPKGHDLTYEITRVSEYTNSLKSGGFPVRWAANLDGGYGEPIFNFFPPLFLIISAIQILLGFSISLAIKCSIFFFTLAGGIGMYLFAREFHGRNGGLFAACVYIIAPYHLVDIYIRNAYSEYTACSIAPFVFWGIALICKEKYINSRSILLLTTSGTLFILSHNLSLVMYVPILAVFFFLNCALNRNLNALISVSIAGAIIVFLTLFYIFPLLFEKEFIQTSQLTIQKFDVFKNFKSVVSLFGFSSWYSLTPLSLILFLLVVVVMIFKKGEINRKLYANLCLFLGFFLILLFLITPSSRAIWETFSFMRLFQFPWRLLSPVTLVLCFLAGSIILLRESYIKLFSRKEKNTNARIVLPVITFILFIIGAIFVSLSGDQSRYVITTDSKFTPENIRRENFRATVANEYRPIWVKEKSELPFGKGIMCLDPNAEIKVIKISSTIRNYTVNLKNKCPIVANVHFFPGWKIYDNGISIHYKITKQGLMDFTLPPGTHHLKIVFENTSVRWAGNFLSILGLFMFGALLFIDLKTWLREKLSG